MASKSRGRPYSEDREVESSLRHSIKDGIYYSVLTGGAESYFSAFAIFLHASTTVVGLVASLPPLLASFMQMLSAWVGRRFGIRKRIIVFGALLQAACLVPLALSPVFAPVHAAWLLIPIIFVYFCGPNLGSPQWNSLIGDLVPEGRRGRFFAERTRLSSVASVSALIVAGLLLDVTDRWSDAYWGFVLVFAFTGLARLASAWHLEQMHEPTRKTAALEVIEDLTLWRRFRHSRLMRFSLFYAAMQFAVAISGPYFTLYLLRDLEQSYFEFMTITVASVLVQFLTLNRWGRLADVFGNRLLLIATGSIITVIPSLWLVSTHYGWLLVVQSVSGLAWAGFTLSATAYVFDLTPSEHRATLIAVHNVFAAIAVFLGAGLGALIARYVPDEVHLFGYTVTVLTPLYGLFLASCLTRLAVALLFLPLLREFRRVRPMSVGGLIFRVTRMHPVTGLIYEIVGRVRPRGRRRRTGGEADGHRSSEERG